MKNGYKLRQLSNGRAWEVTIPAHISRLLPDPRSLTFEFELTDEGILMRPRTSEPEPVRVPAWVGDLSVPAV